MGLYDQDKRDICKLEQEKEVFEFIKMYVDKNKKSLTYKELSKANSLFSSTSTVKETLERSKE